MAEAYWASLLEELTAAKMPLHVLEQRGEKLGSKEGVVVLSRPAHIGGQEFDVVFIVGAEHGLLPPRVVNNDALAVAVEQQALRELYLSITRARHKVMVMLSRGATLSSILSEAAQSGLLSVSGSSDK